MPQQTEIPANPPAAVKPAPDETHSASPPPARTESFFATHPRAPMFLVIAALILPIVAMGIRHQGPLRNMAPFLTLIIIWLAAVPVIRMRGQRELQREIAELNEIEKTNR